MTTKTVTVDQLITEYAESIADEAGLDISDYDTTASGLASLLRDTAGGCNDQVAEWLEEAAANLDAVSQLGDGGSETQKLLKNADRNLYEAKADLELG